MKPDTATQAAEQAKAWIIGVALLAMVGPFVVWDLVEAAKTPAGGTGEPPGMAWIPGGEFTMGDGQADAGHPEEAPGHRVIVKGFWMDVTEVTSPGRKVKLRRKTSLSFSFSAKTKRTPS